MQHNQEYIRAKRHYCFNHVNAVPRKCGIQMPVYLVESRLDSVLPLVHCDCVDLLKVKKDVHSQDYHMSLIPRSVLIVVLLVAVIIGILAVALLPAVTDYKNWLKDFAIPIGAAILSAVVASWGFFQAQWRKYYFERLIKSELAELLPTIDERKDGKLQLHLNKRFIHRMILSNPTQNPELIFTIDPKLIYFTSQLWSAFDNNDANQWLKYLSMLAFHPNNRIYAEGTCPQTKVKFDDKGEIRKAYYEWLAVFKKYLDRDPKIPEEGFLFNDEALAKKFPEHTC